MSKRVLFLRAVAPWGLLLLALVAAGCGRRHSKEAELKRMAELERMAECLETNVPETQGGEPKGSWPEDNALPPPGTTGFRLEHEFWVDQQGSRKTTVRVMLVELGASLRDGKVVDENGRQLYFYRVEDYHAELDTRPRQKTGEDLRKLEKQYRVIRMYHPMPKD